MSRSIVGLISVAISIVVCMSIVPHTSELYGYTSLPISSLNFQVGSCPRLHPWNTEDVCKQQAATTDCDQKFEEFTMKKICCLGDANTTECEGEVSIVFTDQISGSAVPFEVNCGADTFKSIPCTCSTGFLNKGECEEGEESTQNCPGGKKKLGQPNC